MTDSDPTLRSARQDDAERLLAWRNDPDASAASRTGSVDESGHAAWLDGVLGDPWRHLLIVELDEEPVGQIRFDRRRGFEYEISVGLDPSVRGRGLGAQVIAGGCEWLWSRTHASRVIAEVSETNPASLSAFETSGFRRTGEEDDGFVILSLAAPEPFAARSPADRRRQLAFSD